MRTVTLNKVLELADKLSPADQVQLIAEVKARQRKRTAWLRRLDATARQARADLRAGKLKPEPLPAALKRLHKLADQAR
jgi:hypothetical protein